MAPIEGVAASHLLSGSVGQAVASLSAIESNFLQVTAPGVGAYDDDHASLLVALEYLTALEGDFWVKLRGAGLTYGYRLLNSTDTRLMVFALYRCSDVLAAYRAARQIVVDYASGEAAIEEVTLEGSKSSLAYNIISAVASKKAATSAAWSCALEGKGVDYDKWLLQRVDQVGTEEVLHALRMYVVPIFDAGANLVVTCPSNKLDDVCDGVAAEVGIEVRVPEEPARHSAAAPRRPAPAGKRTAPPRRVRQALRRECPKCRSRSSGS